ncbi:MULTISPECIES: hypothetical protein [Photobacterium]|uniref:hypothetical protein n=1 Tax=Photobacterium TaxID=657 RepID=UPI001C2D0DED|nr:MULTISPECIES: hypothetical protein [Photobacterium]MBV1841007.1 hypothetical protein [Photobacterium ganghwense]
MTNKFQHVESSSNNKPEKYQSLSAQVRTEVARVTGVFFNDRPAGIPLKNKFAQTFAFLAESHTKF